MDLTLTISCLYSPWQRAGKTKIIPDFRKGNFFLLCSIFCVKKGKLWKVIFKHFFSHRLEVSDNLFRVNRSHWCLKGQLLSFDLQETECVCTLEGWNQSCSSVKPEQWSFSWPWPVPGFLGRAAVQEVLPWLWGTRGGSWCLCGTMEVLEKGQVGLPRGRVSLLQLLNPGFISNWYQRNRQKHY